jgi:hypothetical protein
VNPRLGFGSPFERDLPEPEWEVVAVTQHRPEGPVVRLRHLRVPATMQVPVTFPYWLNRVKRLDIATIKNEIDHANRSSQ